MVQRPLLVKDSPKRQPHDARALFLHPILQVAKLDLKSAADRELAIQQIVSRAVVSTEIVDIMKAAGLESPDISILSDEFGGGS